MRHDHHWVRSVLVLAHPRSRRIRCLPATYRLHLELVLRSVVVPAASAAHFPGPARAIATLNARAAAGSVRTGSQGATRSCKAHHTGKPERHVIQAGREFAPQRLTCVAGLKLDTAIRIADFNRDRVTCACAQIEEAGVCAVEKDLDRCACRTSGAIDCGDPYAPTPRRTGLKAPLTGCHPSSVLPAEADLIGSLSMCRAKPTRGDISTAPPT
mgnify:CR=1 FL=1